jgi:dTDP-4-dehydrorhamnose 3,5-epimerase
VEFTETKLPGVWLVECDVFPDDRGTFTRAWAPEPFVERGLETGIAQVSLSSNTRRGTIRGLHFQSAPYEEVKVVRAIRGAVHDVAVDLRPDSPTYLQWIGAELTATNRRMLYVPRGCAHGYQTLSDDAEVLYFVSTPYTPSHQQGIRWNDPALAITWPLGPPTSISERDRRFPDFQAAPVR